MWPGQIRAARGFLGCSRTELATLTGLTTETIKNIETGRFVPRQKTADTLRDFFVSRGIGFFEVQGGLRGVILDQTKSDDALKNREVNEISLKCASDTL